MGLLGDTQSPGREQNTCAVNRVGKFPNFIEPFDMKTDTNLLFDENVCRDVFVAIWAKLALLFAEPVRWCKWPLICFVAPRPYAHLGLFILALLEDRIAASNSNGKF